eukprot:scaffold7469_cov76-Amphora_coffeaeformis.AAC.2
MCAGYEIDVVKRLLDAHKQRRGFGVANRLCEACTTRPKSHHPPVQSTTTTTTTSSHFVTFLKLSFSVAFRCHDRTQNRHSPRGILKGVVKWRKPKANDIWRPKIHNHPFRNECLCDRITLWMCDRHVTTPALFWILRGGQQSKAFGAGLVVQTGQKEIRQRQGLLA